jgi:C1A family cysteine protease
MNYGPVLVSIKWYDNNKLLPNGVIEFDETSPAGYHAVMVYGWNKDGWLCQNSWGKDWNKDGTFIQKYDPGFREAWSFVDAVNPDVVAPANNKWTKWITPIINWCINMFYSIFKR